MFKANPTPFWPAKRMKTYRIDVGLFGGKAGLLKPNGVRGVIGKAGVSGRGDVSASVSDRYDENDSSRTCISREIGKFWFRIWSFSMAIGFFDLMKIDKLSKANYDGNCNSA